MKTLSLWIPSAFLLLATSSFAKDSSILFFGAPASEKAVKAALGAAAGRLGKTAARDSIVVTDPSGIEKAVARFGVGTGDPGALILLESDARHPAEESLAELQRKTHDVLPASRVSVAKTAAQAVKQVREITREQKRLAAGIGGIGTVPAPAIPATVKSWKYVGGKRTQVDVPNRPIAPLGSASMTSAGDLAKTGVEKIVHTASGSMMHRGPGYEPTVESISNSLVNAVALARAAGYTRVASPIIAGSIFRSRVEYQGQMGIDLQTLVDIVVGTLARESAGMKIVLTIRDNSPEEAETIAVALKKLSPGDAARFEVAPIVQAALAKFSAHHAPVVINSANMELLFGGGVSGQVADGVNGILPPDAMPSPGAFPEARENPQTTQSDAIDADNAKKAKLFHAIR